MRNKEKNVVMVKKKNGKWRMCTDLNKCYLKDDFLLSRIDKVVDSAAGCETMALLDCFSGYHQIWLHKEDEEKMSFYHTLRHVLLHENARRPQEHRPMFCRMMKAILRDQIHRNVFT
jgi:hypothetical protein